jgi:serine/threonine-protein kinase RsbW
MHDGPALIHGSPERRLEELCTPPRVSADDVPDRLGDGIRLTLPANAQNVVLIRHVTAAFAARERLPETLVEDLKLAVTEACTNVVRHAYASGAEGHVEVDIAAAPEAVHVAVTDGGLGLRPNPASDGAGLGLPLMAALADSIEIEPAGGSGSRVLMSFRRAG